jgi:uncharacterized membrane protein (UPF0127 family)
MRAVKINPGKGKEIIASRVTKANNFLSRLFGLIIRKKLKDKEGFLIENCSSIHTFWMRYSIDVIFLDKKNLVLDICHNIKPFRATPFIRNAYYALELKSGTTEKASLEVGDLVQFET